MLINAVKHYNGSKPIPAVFMFQMRVQAYVLVGSSVLSSRTPRYYIPLRFLRHRLSLAVLFYLIDPSSALLILDQSDAPSLLRCPAIISTQELEVCNCIPPSVCMIITILDH